MFGLFGKKKPSKANQVVTTNVIAPAEGRLLALSEVPDQVFAGGIMGPGFAVDLESGDICSPVDGEVILIADTLHAFAVRSTQGVEVLVHIGVDTVALKGEGFTALHAVGDQVSAGEPIIRIELDKVRQQVPSLITPVVVTNASEYPPFEPDLTAAMGSTVIKIDAR